MRALASDLAEDARGAVVLGRLTVREAVRGRAARGLLGAGVALLGLLGFAAAEALDAARAAGGTVTVDVVGATLLGTAAFVALLLGAIVAVFLTHGAIRGDAERGLLQTVLVRPVGRGAVVLGRLAAGAAVAGVFTGLLWLAAVAVVRVAGGWSAPAVVAPALALALAAALVAVTATAASAFAGPMAAGIITLALVGLGFTVGLLAQLGSTLGLQSLADVAEVLSALLPFEALYRDVLHATEGDLGDLAAAGATTGPFGGARDAAPWLGPWIAAWTTGVLGAAVVRTRTLDV